MNNEKDYTNNKDFDNLFTIIIPTHRPNFLIELINNISNQIIKPDRIIFILDKLTELEIELIINSNKYLLNNIRIYIIRSGLTGALNAFKQCFKQMEQFYDKTKNNYYQIIEDDVEYLTRKSIKYIRDFISVEYPEFFYVNVVDSIDNSVNNINLSKNIEYYDNSDQSKHSIILDTCGMIFCFNKLNYYKIKSFNKIIKNLGYTLIADSFAFQYFVNNIKFKIIHRSCIRSKIHIDQVSANINTQVFENSIQWKYIFKKNGVSNKHIKFDTYNQFIIKILACIKIIGLDTNITPIKPNYNFFRELYRILITNSSIDILFEFIKNNPKQFIWFYNISLEIDKAYIDINPYLKESLK